MFLLYLIAELACNPHASILPRTQANADNRIDITEYVNLTLALSQCSLVPCYPDALEQIKKQIQCENDEIERLYLERFPDAIAPVEIKSEREGDRFYIPLD